MKKLTNEQLEAQVVELECMLIELEDKLCKVKVTKPGRKDEVLEILQAGKVSVADIAKQIGISARNVSSQLTYLRRDGYPIGTDSKGRKFIESN